MVPGGGGQKGRAGQAEGDLREEGKGRQAGRTGPGPGVETVKATKAGWWET